VGGPDGRLIALGQCVWNWDSTFPAFLQTGTGELDLRLLSGALTLVKLAYRD
jgi:hypothetical protein